MTDDRNDGPIWRQQDKQVQQEQDQQPQQATEREGETQRLAEELDVQRKREEELRERLRQQR